VCLGGDPGSGVVPQVKQGRVECTTPPADASVVGEVNDGVGRDFERMRDYSSDDCRTMSVERFEDRCCAIRSSCVSSRVAACCAKGFSSCGAGVF